MNNTPIKQSNLETPTGGSVMLRLIEDENAAVCIKVQILTTDIDERDGLNRWCTDWFGAPPNRRAFNTGSFNSFPCKDLNEGFPLFADITHSCALKVARMKTAE